MNDVVIGFDVLGDDVVLIDLRSLVAAIDLGGRPLDRRYLDHGPAHVVIHHLARNQVVGQHGHQLVLVLRPQQRLKGAGGQSDKGLVDRREDGEGTAALQGVHQTGGLDGSDPWMAVTSVLKSPFPAAISTMSLANAVVAAPAIRPAVASERTSLLNI